MQQEKAPFIFIKWVRLEWTTGGHSVKACYLDLSRQLLNICTSLGSLLLSSLFHRKESSCASFSIIQHQPSFQRTEVSNQKSSAITTT